MSKAENKALEKYPLISEDDKEGLEALKYIGMECECSSVFNEAQEAKQAYFIEGYKQAEKDVKEELSNLFQEFMLDCINDDTETHILHFTDVFNNKIKTIGNE